MFEFLLISALAGIGVALMTGPLGSFVVWRRLAYFGDTLAHGALIGVALGLMLQINTQWAVVFSSIILAISLLLLQKRSRLTNDTLLGILSHSALAGGLVVIGLLDNQRVDLYGLLFGDLLTATWNDVGLIYLVAAGISATLALFWRSLLSITLDEKMAKVEGLAVERFNLLLMVLMALVVAFAMKVVGILLITALLIIPAAASRHLAKNPEGMAVFASVIGMVSVILGLSGSYFLDTPAGPSIVLSAALIFLSSRLLAR